MIIMDVKTMKHNFQYGEPFQIGSEDALSSVDDLNVNEQLSMKVHNVEQVRCSRSFFLSRRFCSSCVLLSYIAYCHQFTTIGDNQWYRVFQVSK